jgi:glycosyltransferase involved in cell wall biosynthesis
MNIAFISTSTGWGGLEMNILKLAGLLKDKGYHIMLITHENSTIYNKGKDLFLTRILLKNKRKYFDFKSAKIISNALQKEGIKTIIVFDNQDLDVVAWTKKLFLSKLNVIYQQHMQIGINKRDILHTFRFNSINYWISPLQYLKNEISERTRFPVDRVKVIPICLDVKKFVQRKYSKQEALNALNISPKAPLVGIIGRIDRKKGQLFLVESLMKLKQKGVDVELLIFGNATVNDAESKDYYNEICNTVKLNNLDDCIHFSEYREDVAIFYNAVDVFVLASHSETYGMVTIEAMLSKTPVIATKSGGTNEILENGNLGALYEYGNQDDFCQQLIWMIHHENESANRVEKAHEVASQKYLLEIEINEIDSLIRNL